MQTQVVKVMIAFLGVDELQKAGLLNITSPESMIVKSPLLILRSSWHLYTGKAEPPAYTSTTKLQQTQQESLHSC